MIRGKKLLKNGKYLKSIMIGTEGMSDTGKSEFILTCPGPGLVLVIDRGIDPVFDNQTPPANRRNDFAFKIFEAPKNTQATQAEYVQHFKDIRAGLYAAALNPDALTIGIDGDSDLWELHQLASLGKLTGVYPQTKYGEPYAERRAMTARLHDSGKIIIATNKVKDEYVTVYNVDGTEKKDQQGNKVTERSGEKRRQGFPDQDYLWNVQIRHLFQPAKINTVTNKLMPKKWGLKVLKCKANTDVVGEELWGDDCCFQSLMELCYPQIDPSEWGL